MDAVKYLKTKRRLCNAHTECRKCPLNITECGYAIGAPCGELERENVEELVRRVEKWAKEHPVETRQSRFLKEFPRTSAYTDGTIDICPRLMDKTLECKASVDAEMECIECERKYWSEEIEDGGN